MIGKQDGKIAGMIAMGLVVWVPVFPCSQEGVFWIAHATVAPYVQMEAVGADGVSAGWGGPITGKARHLNRDEGSSRDILKPGGSADLGITRTARDASYSEPGEPVDLFLGSRIHVFTSFFHAYNIHEPV